MEAILSPSGSDRQSRIVRWRLLPALLVPAIALPAQEVTSPNVELAREALTNWTDTQRIISKEKQAWREGKETLAARIEIVRREIESLQQRTESARASIAEADAKRAELLAENERRKQVATGLEQQIGGLERRALALLPRLPVPLADRVKPYSQRLPESPEKALESKLSLSERYQNVIAVLNEISKWNREVTVTTELREMPNGTSLEVIVFYIGLGQGYYAGGIDEDGKATVGGIGTATAKAWVWKPANELAPAIQQAIAVYKNEQLAKLVRLPVQIL